MANRITRHIPNILTCMNLFSGCIAGVAAFEAQYGTALLFIVAGAVADFLDGLAARVLDAHSVIGKDLDSLADDISFGLVPSLIAFSLFREMYYPAWMEGVAAWLPYTAFLIAAFSALRLARFNNDARQATSFIGLPVPANALLWASLAAGYRPLLVGGSLRPLCLLALVCLSSWLLVSGIPMFSLKFRRLSWKDDKMRFAFLLLCAFFIATLRVKGLAACIVCYILVSLLTGRKKA